MHWALCLLRGGHRPMRLALSETRIVCRRCGLELDSLGTAQQQPARPEMPPTTIKRYTSKRPRF